MRLALDLDGVIFNFETAFADLLETELGIKNQQRAEWNWWMKDGAVTKEQNKMLWNKIIHSDFWKHVKPYPGVKQFLNALHLRRQHEVFFITSRSGVTVKDDSELALAMAGYPGATVLPVNKPEKKLPILQALDIKVFVDDKPETVVAAYQQIRKCKSMLYSQPWNEHVQIPRGIKRISNLDFLLAENPNG